MPKAWYNRLVDMLTSRFGALERNSKWNQHVRLFQPRRALPPDEPELLRVNVSRGKVSPSMSGTRPVSGTPGQICCDFGPQRQPACSPETPACGFATGC